MSQYQGELLEFERCQDSKMLEESRHFLAHMSKRRTVRDFSEQPVNIEIIQNAIKAAATAPNGANLQAWHFVIIQDQQIKDQIRIAAEEEERAFYDNRATPEWLDKLAHLGTDASKPFLSKAPVLIGIFYERYRLSDGATKEKVYYPLESVGIATGMLISALHLSGLATLTHTPSPMKFMNRVMHRPSNEKPFLLLVVGYPENDAHVPVITKRPFDEVCTVL